MFFSMFRNKERVFLFENADAVRFDFKDEKASSTLHRFYLQILAKVT